MKMQVTFKSGAQITVDADEVTTGRQPTGDLTKLAWTTPDDWVTKLHTLDVREVVAVVMLREAGADG